jgi:hypothetical protein
MCCPLDDSFAAVSVTDHEKRLVVIPGSWHPYSSKRHQGLQKPIMPGTVALQGLMIVSLKALPPTLQATSPAFATRCNICNKDPEQTRTSASSNRSSLLDVSRHQMLLTGRKLRPELWRTPGETEEPLFMQNPSHHLNYCVLGSRLRVPPLVTTLCAGH